MTAPEAQRCSRSVTYDHGNSWMNCRAPVESEGMCHDHLVHGDLADSPELLARAITAQRRREQRTASRIRHRQVLRRIFWGN